MGETRRLRPVPVGPVDNALRMLLTCLFMTALIAGPVLGVRIIELGPYHVTAGALVFPWSFSILVVLTEVYGVPMAYRQAVYGVGCLTLVGLLFEVTDILPTSRAGVIEGQDFHVLYGIGFSPVFVVVLGFGLGCMAGIATLYVWASLTHGRLLWLRICGVPLIGQAVNSLVAIPLIFFSRVSHAALAVLIVDRLAIAVIFSVVTAPIIYAAIIAARRYERPPPAYPWSLSRGTRSSPPDNRSPQP